MTKITATEVNKLRKMTGAGMMDCKKALTEADGDYDKAVKIIREKGQAIASKRSDREATEGVAIAKTNSDATKGYMIALNCETDFVAKNNDFISLAESILELTIDKDPADLDELKKLDFKGKKVEDVVVEQTGIIGEKIDLSYFEKVSAEQVSAYIHGDKKLATLVGLSKSGIDKQVGKDIAMQVAAMDPVAIDKEDVSQEIKDREMEIGRNQALKEGKPEKIVDKIAEGKLNKFFKENTLLNQDFIKEGKMTVKQYLQGADKDLTVKTFKRCSLKQ